MESLPKHLRKYVVDQDYSKYTPVDQAVWRFILRQLRAFLSVHAHECYLEGLEKTGIEVERIPRIEDISRKISGFGWRALPVSGFIPPAAFMELQALGVLPIASDMRTLDHLLYTPAPDIVHEAAGHAPILIHPEFASYLREYAQVARKAIISREDLDLYEAIRNLSDLKEHPDSTPEQIQAAQNRLDEFGKSMSHVSEASELSRMNWWTAEYGLIGSLDRPKLFGAGLLSSVGEARWCLSEKVKKIPLTVDCIRTSYDITEPQPQLFVTPDFKTLSRVLEEMAQGMAFRTGGLKGLAKALRAKTVNSVQWNSGLQVGGELAEIIDDRGEPAYLRFQGPCQLAFEERELPGHDKSYHAQGFSSPVGRIRGFDGCPSRMNDADLENLGLKTGARARLEFQSGVVVEGVFASATRRKEALLLLTFKDAKVSRGDRVFFEPSWGTYDMAVGESIPSVFGGAPDREAFGEIDDFVAARVPPRHFTDREKLLHSQYSALRRLRENGTSGTEMIRELDTILETHDRNFPEDWLLRIEALELILTRTAGPELESRLREDLEGIQKKRPATRDVIQDGISLAARM